MRNWLVALLLVPGLVLAPWQSVAAAERITCWFPPGWSSPEQARAIAEVLGKGSGAEVSPRIATGFPEIIAAFAGDGMHLAYAGSFVQAIIVVRKLGTTVTQAVDGNEFYAGVMIYPAGQDPQTILQATPARIAYARGTSSGESTARAATAGKAALGVDSHAAAIEAVLSGKARAAMVKDAWWQASKGGYRGLKLYEIPGISERKHPDNILTASAEIPAELRERIGTAAQSGAAAFGPNAALRPFDNRQLNFSLGLMLQGRIDPLSYKW